MTMQVTQKIDVMIHDDHSSNAASVVQLICIGAKCHYMPCYMLQ